MIEYTGYLLATKEDKIGIFCDNNLRNARLAEEGQLGICFIRSYNTVHSLGPTSLQRK